jgi:hypothetical protein
MPALFSGGLTRSREEHVMTMIRRRTVLGGGLAVYLLVAGFAGEHATEAAR